MMSVLPVGVIGAGRHASALLDHATAFGQLRLAAWAASPDGSDADAAAACAVRAGAAPRLWQAVAGDPSLAAVLLLGSAGPEAAEAALRAGRLVLCPPPAAPDDAALARLIAAERAGGGTLLLGGELAHGEAGSRALAAIRDPAFGALRTLFLSVHQPRGAGPDILEAAGWEALDFVLAVLPGRVVRAQATGGALFGGATRDTLSALLLCDDGVVVTLELSRCLPATIPAPGLGEVEIEAVGTRQSVRATPHAEAVRILGDRGVNAAPWLDPPVALMLRRLAAACETRPPSDLPRAAATLAVMTAIRAALA
jgi:predicted dehydrogenase